MFRREKQWKTLKIGESLLTNWKHHSDRTQESLDSTIEIDGNKLVFWDFAELND